MVHLTSGLATYKPRRRMSDVELARRIAVGDRDAAELFAREHYPAVLRLATRLCGNGDDAGDIAQETFIVARRDFGRYRGGASLRTWVHKIAFNEYRQWKRKRRALPLFDLDFPIRDEAIESFEAGHALMAALANIPNKPREAFILFEVEQLAMNEVAKVLGVPVGTAKARVFYARQHLRQHFEDLVSTTDELKRSTSHG